MQTVQRYVEWMNRLYEQGADAVRISKYVRRWRKWVGSGLNDYDLVSAVVKPSPYVAAAGKLPLQVPAVQSPAE